MLLLLINVCGKTQLGHIIPLSYLYNKYLILIQDIDPWSGSYQEDAIIVLHDMGKTNQLNVKDSRYDTQKRIYVKWTLVIVVDMRRKKHLVHY